jgi:hypothetical protein
MSDSEMIGPPLPPHLLPAKHKQSADTRPQVSRPTSSPECSWLNQSSGTSDSDLSSSESESERKTSNIIGPMMSREHKTLKEDHASTSDELIGPELPPGFRKSTTPDHSDSDDGYGPRPPVPGQDRVVTVAEQLEERAQKMKYRLIHGVSTHCEHCNENDEDNPKLSNRSFVFVLGSK